MSKGPINFLSHELMRFFNNSDKGFYEFQKKQKEFMTQERLYSKKNRVFKAVCLSNHEHNTPSILARIFPFNKFEKQTIKIRFYGEDSDRNGPLGTDPMDTSLSEDTRRALINDCADFATVTDPSLQINYGDLLMVRQNTEGKYFVVKKVGNLNQITPPVSVSGYDFSPQTPSTTLSNYTLDDSPEPPAPVKPIEVNNLVQGITDEDFVLLFGDSQMQGSTTGGLTIGGTLQKQFKNTKRIGNSGKKPSFYVTNFNLIEKHLQKKPKLIMIVLGGNISEKILDRETKSSLKLIDMMKKITPGSKIIWIGPPPNSLDGTTKAWSTKGFLESRKRKNNYLEQYLSPAVDVFINSYKVGNFSEGYRCAKKCDGVHMPGKYAEAFLAQAGLLKNFKPPKEEKEEKKDLVQQGLDKVKEVMERAKKQQEAKEKEK